MSVRAEHAAVVLAGGGSARLGRPKQLLTRAGETLVHRAVRLAGATRPARLLVVAGARHPTIAAAVADLDCEVVWNADWANGLSSSLRCAAQALHDHRGPVLLLGCDQPALAAEHLQHLLQLATRRASGCAATVHGAGVGSPAVVTAAVLRGAELAGDHGLGRLLNALPGGAVSRMDAPELQFDINTEADVLLAIERGWLDPSQARP
ncbi:MAG TPA: nucleotidyltransferase family protein [Lysobacter sp.]|nr:nucleotidyltransferase family protein [Lysobacter sp.]